MSVGRGDLILVSTVPKPAVRRNSWIASCRTVDQSAPRIGYSKTSHARLRRSPQNLVSDVYCHERGSKSQNVENRSIERRRAGVAERPFEHDIGILNVLHIERAEDAVGQSEKLLFIP